MTTETITQGRVYYERHPGLDVDSGPGDACEITTQVDVAALLDDAAYESIEEHGCRGAASAHAEIGYGEDEEDDWERLDTMDHPDVCALPMGTPADVRSEMRERREVTVWDGNNHVFHPLGALEELLARMRRSKKA